MTRSFQDYQKEKQEREWKEKVQSRKEAMNNAQRVSRATEFKTIGNDKFKCGNLLEARDYYREAVIYVEDLVDARRKEKVELLMPLYANLAQVYLRVEEHSAAEEVCNKALTLAEVPRNNVSSSLRAKAHFRRAVARRVLGKAEEARDDLQTVLQMQPDHAEVQKELAAVRAILSDRAKQAKAAWGGFLQRPAVDKEAREERDRKAQEKRQKAAERRQERLRRAEERQQMQDAFEKLSKGKMLYEAREREMEPVRKKELEKTQTLELEQKLLNIIDESKGKPKTEKLEDFMKQREARAWDQSAELDQKKKVLEKVKKEEQWSEDDAWRDQRLEHRKQIQARGQVQTPQMWEAKQVDRWCQQRLRDLLVPLTVQGESPLPSELSTVLEEPTEKTCMLRALITDVLKLEGDAAVINLNRQKQPLHYFDYFLKMDWEVHVAVDGDKSYRTADELIEVASLDNEQKAPASVAKNRVIGGTVKIREFSSEEIPADGQWPLLVKVKRRYKGDNADEAKFKQLEQLCEALRERLFQEVQKTLFVWLEEYRDYWAPGSLQSES